MNYGVVPLAEQDQIVEVGAATGTPGHPVVSLQMPDGVAAGVLTHPVADHQRPALRCADQPPSPAQREHLAVPIDDRT
jgi:hypothetical protein